MPNEAARPRWPCHEYRPRSRLSAAATESILALRHCPAESRKSCPDERPCHRFVLIRMSHPSDTSPAGSGSQPGRPSPLDQDLSGRQLGDYRLLRRLGRGGMAEVYLAEQLSLKRQVAFKVLRADLAENEDY